MFQIVAHSLSSVQRSHARLYSFATMKVVAIKPSKVDFVLHTSQRLFTSVAATKDARGLPKGKEFVSHMVRLISGNFAVLTDAKIKLSEEEFVRSTGHMMMHCFRVPLE